MALFTKSLEFMSTATVYIETIINVQTKRNFPTLMTSLRNKHQPNCRLIYGCFHKNFEVHISNSLWNKKRQSIFKKREISLFWRSQYAISIPVIIGSLMSWLVLQNPRNTSQQKFIKETVAINIQINKNFLVLMTSSRRRHYRF